MGESDYDRQMAEYIMKRLGIESLMFELEDASIEGKISMLTILSMSVSCGILYERTRADELREQKKERTKERKTIYNNNKEKQKTKEKTILLDLRSDDVKIVKESETKKPKRQMPKDWIDAWDRQVIEDQKLIDYCQKKHGLDEHYAKTQFLAFVEWHMSKGSMFVRWNYAFYKWVSKDLKWHGKPATHLGGSMISSYKTKNPIEGLFDED
jgi:hypothetical protein